MYTIGYAEIPAKTGGDVTQSEFANDAKSINCAAASGWTLHNLGSSPVFYPVDVHGGSSIVSFQHISLFVVPPAAAFFTGLYRYNKNRLNSILISCTGKTSFSEFCRKLSSGINYLVNRLSEFFGIYRLNPVLSTLPVKIGFLNYANESFNSFIRYLTI